MIKSFLLELPGVRRVATAIKPKPAEHVVKQEALKELATRFSINTLVETGTYRGDMIEAMKATFNRLYSIELSKELFAAAEARFADDNHVEIIFGDSGEKLAELVPKLDEPSLFWLDGHYSGGVTAKGATDCPVLNECNSIFDSKVSGHVIVVDDARLFGKDPSYPTLEELSDRVKKVYPNYVIEVKHDAIRVMPG